MKTHCLLIVASRSKLLVLLIHDQRPVALDAEQPIVVPDSKGGFDFIQADSSRRRLLATHTGNARWISLTWIRKLLKTSHGKGKAGLR